MLAIRKKMENNKLRSCYSEIKKLMEANPWRYPDSNNAVVCELLKQAKIVIRYKSNSGLVSDVLRDRGWQQVEESTLWNLNWGDLFDAQNLLKSSILNDDQYLASFWNGYELSKKTLLSRNMLRLKKTYLKEGKYDEAKICDCMPITFEIPDQYMMFEEEYRKNIGQTWIVKPAVGSRGRGIFLFRDIRELNEWTAGRDFLKVSPDGEELIPDSWLVQKYIENPYLLGGKKFDLRLYVLVQSFAPLKAWVNREGFARLCGTNYNRSILKDNYIHLTNASLQMSEKCTSLDNHQQGSKIHIRQLRQLLSSYHGVEAIDLLIQKLGKVILSSLLSAQRSITNNKHSFELFGYDILLDEHLNPWLLEINSRPALESTDKEDYELKYNLISDVMNVIDIEKRMNGNEIRIGGFDLLFDKVPVSMPCPGADEIGPIIDPQRLNIFVGALNNREEQLRCLGSWNTFTSARSKKDAE